MELARTVQKNGKLHFAPVQLKPHDATPGADFQSPPMTARVLVVDDDALIYRQLEVLYSASGYMVVMAHSAEDGLKRLEGGDIDVVVTDLRLPGASGIEMTQRIQQMWPDVPVIVVTGHADIDTAVEVLKMGASDYIVKPFSLASLQKSTRAVLEQARDFIAVRHLRRLLKDRYEFGGMLSKTPEMHKVFETIRMVANTDVTVLVQRETGTGKELVASAVHHQSPRRKGPFVTINCGGIPETLLESELFGFERGSFTGADQARPGKIELAQGGTLFLDEIESMSLAMQAKLLLALQNRRVQRLGGARQMQVDMRVSAASNVPLEQLVASGQMRRDFYYRINVIPIHLPPLRSRRDDIPLLVQDFLHHHPVALAKEIARLSTQAMGQLLQYPWPGNVRELHNVLERAIVLTTGHLIENVDVPEAQPPTHGEDSSDAGPLLLPLRRWLREQERSYLIRQLDACEGKIGLTAQRCGIDLKTLYRKMHAHKLTKKAFRKETGSSSQNDV